MAFFTAMEWHEGEKMMQEKLRAGHVYNTTVPMLSPQAVAMLQRAPLLAVGTLDEHGQPWTTLWGGDKGFAQPIGDSIIGVRTPAAATCDPVVELLVGSGADGEVVQHAGRGKMLSGLTIDLETRKRVKISGRLIAGVLSASADDGAALQRQGSIQLAVNVEQSLGNCPKYLNKKRITPATTSPRVETTQTPLCDSAVALIHRCDLFFISTSRSDLDMDTNHRGGPAGFVRVTHNDQGATVIVYPEYSGNRMYQSLGNMILNPKAGICFPDFDTGDCLYVTGSTEILVGKDAAALLPRSNLVVKVTVTDARFVKQVLPFRGAAAEASPYNPNVRLLVSEKQSTSMEGVNDAGNTAKLLEQIKLTPTISRFRFALSNAASYAAGQYVTLDFSEHLDMGYSHMRDDDPRSLNDDFIRTFTVSSPPGLPANPVHRLKDDEFEITMRRVGVVTGFLFDHKNNMPLEIRVKGFGGAFMVKQDEKAPTIAFVAAGVGITPLMPSLKVLDLSKLHLLWTLRSEDIGIATDLMQQHPLLAQRLTLFVTGQDEIDAAVRAELGASKARLERRRMVKADIDALRPSARRYYVCTGNAQRTVLLQWLTGAEVLYEDYNF